MRVRVATRATQALPVVDHRRRLELTRLFVAIAARHRDVTACQDEPRLLVLRKCESGRLISVESVAALAGVEVGRSRELPGMAITVAVRAMRECDLETRLRALRDVALSAFKLCMAAL